MDRRYYNRRRKKRIKTPVKLGCGLIVIALLAAVGYMAYRHYKTPTVTDKPEVQAPDTLEAETPLGKPNADLQRRLMEFQQLPQRLDTNKIAVTVYDLTNRVPVMRWHDKRLMLPASCLKLLTAATAMDRLGLDYQFEVSLGITGKVTDGTLNGNVYVKADDDPLFESFTALADTLKAKGIQRVQGDVYLALLREDTLRAHPTAASWDIPYYKVPLLTKGRKRVERDLRYAIQSRGISIQKDSTLVPNGLRKVDPSSLAYHKALNAQVAKARVICRHTDALKDVLIPMLTNSSNIKADALFYHLDHVGDFSGKNDAVSPHLTEQFIVDNLRYSTQRKKGFVINDGSGLSPENRVNDDFLLQVLIYCWRRPAMREFLVHEAMATPGTPGRCGSLLSRMSAQLFRDRIFCKTGTLVTAGGSSLAGYAKGADGHWYAFSIINEDSPVAESRLYQDRLCRILMQ